MYLDYTPAQKALREEIRAYMTKLMTPELEQELIDTHAGGPLFLEAVRQMGRDGWLGLGYPKAVGGQERGAIDQFIFSDEVQGFGFPLPILTLNTVGPMILQYGSDAQRAQYMGPILAGECHFSIGYTEPNSGTDLASVKTRAEIDGDEFVITGQKIWTSLADHADYMWLLARTDPDSPAHSGLSMIIVPVDSPGIEMTRIHAVGDNSVFAVYYDNVRVPKENLVGELNGGWRLLTGQLNHERIALSTVAPLRRLTRQTRDYAATIEVGEGERLLDQPWVQQNLAELEVDLDTLEFMNAKQAWAIDENRLHPADASAIKVFGSELYIRGARLLMEILGDASTIRTDSPGVALKGEVERFYRTSLLLTYGGGTNEVQRDIIAMAGLRFPRAKRR